MFYAFEYLNNLYFALIGFGVLYQIFLTLKGVYELRHRDR
jgi:hypothetical protein